MNGKRVVVTFPAGDKERQMLLGLLGEHASVLFLADATQEQRAGTLRGADALLAFNLKRELKADEFRCIEKVRFIQFPSAGADRTPFDLLPTCAVIASNVGAYAPPMAEHVLAMTLSVMKRLHVNHEKMRQGQFDQFTPTRTLRGAVCGILGFGGIGRATARLMGAFGARIYAVNTSGKTDEPVEFIGTLHDLDHVLPSSDVLVIALPLHRATRGLMGKEELSRMKKDAIVVNVARGPIIDEKALYDHLLANPEFTAALDAWWIEPLRDGEFRVDYPFFDLPNVLASPHNSAMVPGAIGQGRRRAAENVLRYLKGEEVTGVVRREDYIW